MLESSLSMGIFNPDGSELVEQPLTVVSHTCVVPEDDLGGEEAEFGERLRGGSLPRHVDGSECNPILCLCFLACVPLSLIFSLYAWVLAPLSWVAEALGCVTLAQVLCCSEARYLPCFFYACCCPCTTLDLESLRDRPWVPRAWLEPPEEGIGGSTVEQKDPGEEERLIVDGVSSRSTVVRPAGKAGYQSLSETAPLATADADD